MTLAPHTQLAAGSQSTPKMTLVEALTRSRLQEAWEATLWRDPCPGPDGETAQLFALRAPERLEALFEELHSGRYQPRAARRVWIGRADAAPRGVVALTVTDRIVEGALLRALRPTLEANLSEASFAYRQGLGALQAVQTLMNERTRGWALRGDVADCFDSIPHLPLRESLRPVLAPDLDALLHQLLTRPVTDRTGTHRIQRGLCQGSLLAPLLTNWYLDAFDRQMAGLHLKLVRYADDFVLLTDTPEQAGECVGVASAALSSLGLNLNSRKTRITSRDEGFDFLGFNFRAGDVRVSPARLDTFRAELCTMLEAEGGTVHPARIKAANDLIRGWQAYFRLGQVRLDLAELDDWIRREFPGLPLAQFLPGRNRTVETYRLVRRGRIRRTYPTGVSAQEQRSGIMQATLQALEHAVGRHPQAAFQAAAMVARREMYGEIRCGSTETALQAAYLTVYGPQGNQRRQEARRLLVSEVTEALVEAGASRATQQTAAELLAGVLLPRCFDAYAAVLAPSNVPFALSWNRHLDTSVQGITTLRVLLYREAHRLAMALQQGDVYRPQVEL